MASRSERRRFEVRCQAESLGESRVQYTCPQGHIWSEDLNRKSLPLHRRIQPQGARILIRGWSKDGVIIPCPKCMKERKNG